MTREQLFAAPKVVRRAEERLDRGKAAVSAARARATEIAQQSLVLNCALMHFTDAALRGWRSRKGLACTRLPSSLGWGRARCSALQQRRLMRMNLRVAIGAASALRALQLIDLRIYGSPGFQFHRMKSGELRRRWK